MGNLQGIFIYLYVHVCIKFMYEDVIYMYQFMYEAFILYTACVCIRAAI